MQPPGGTACLPDGSVPASRTSCATACEQIATALQPRARIVTASTAGGGHAERERQMHEHDRRPARCRRLAVAGAIALAPIVLAATAIATPGLNVISAAVQARGTLPEDQIVNSKSGVHLKTKGSTDVVTQKIVLGGGGHTGWHSHPGPVLVTIKAGALRVIYADDASCAGTRVRGR